MEVIHGSLHTAFPMGDPSRVGEARRHGADLAALARLNEVDAGRLALVITELGTNLLRHAQRGQLLLSARPALREVEVIAIDEGPGIADVARSLGDGYSTGGTPGTGLGAVRRLARDFDLHSAVPHGTIAVARVRAHDTPSADRPAMSAAGVSLAAPGEKVCGDAWAFAIDGDRASLVVADGLGHGPDAAEASLAAVEVFRSDPLAPPGDLLERMHARLRATRGAAITIVQADQAAGTFRTVGAGNVVGRVVSGVSDKTLLGQHGTAGLTIRTPEETQVPWPPHAMLVVFTDGIVARWQPQLLHPVLGRDPAIAAALLSRNHLRGRDDATVAVLRRRD